MGVDAAGFPECPLSCDGVLHKDCSFAFCMSRQGIINVHHRGGGGAGTGSSSTSSTSFSAFTSSGSSFFSFRRRSRFAKMAEHFEYNHIPAQMSSINHFRVKSVVCYRDGLVVLHLSRNANSQFGLLDLSVNKFLGVFGKQHVEFSNDELAGEACRILFVSELTSLESLVWRVRGKIIRSVLSNTVCNNCAQCNAHTYEQT